MVETQMSTKEILLECLEEYSDPTKRALFYPKGTYKDATCRYLDDKGNMCAVGRCMTKAALKKYGDSNRGFRHIARDEGGFDHLLREEYHGQTLEFWCGLQGLHDFHKHWSPEGVTEQGLKYVKRVFNIDL